MIFLAIKFKNKMSSYTVLQTNLKDIRKHLKKFKNNSIICTKIALNKKGYFYEGTIIKKMNSYVLINGKLCDNNDNIIFEGKWKNDTFCEGTLYKKFNKCNPSEGEYYQGEIENKLPNGYGKIIKKINETINGKINKNELKNKLQYGYKKIGKNKGKIKIEKKYTYYTINYEGIWKNGKLKSGIDSSTKKWRIISDSIVILTKSNSKYKGEMENGKYNGVGKKKYENGDKYIGNWKNGYKQGRGKMEYNNGDVYEGNWEKGLMSGNGKMIYSNDDIFIGEWHDSQKKKGIYIDKKLSSNIFHLNLILDSYFTEIDELEKCYALLELKDNNIEYTQGIWENDELNGTTNHHRSSKTEIFGNLTNGILNGIFDIRYPTGIIKIGNIKNGLMHGIFKCYESVIYEEKWKNNILVK